MSSAAAQPVPGSSPVDWGALYNQLETDGKVPNASSVAIDARNAVFRAMYLNFADLKQQIADSGFNPTHVTVYADVLTIPAGFSWPLASAVLSVYARRVEADPTAAIVLDYRTSTSATLLLFTNDMEGTLAARGVTQSLSQQPVTFSISAANATPGVVIQDRNAVPTMGTIARKNGLPMSPTADFELAMTNSFIFASLLYDDNPSLALDILKWVKDWSAPSPDLLGLFLRSSSLVALLRAQINARANGAAFVPYLTGAVYTQLASAFAAQAGQYESDYINLSTQKVLTDQGIQFAQALRDNAIYQSDYVNGLLAQANANYTNATAAVTAAQTNFRQQQLNVSNAAADFQKIGLPAFEREQIAAAVFSMAMAIVTFGGAIAAMAVGDEAAGPAAAESAIKAVDEVAKASSVAKDLAETMKALKTMMESLKAVSELSASVVNAAKNIADASSLVDSMQSEDLDTSGTSLNSGDQWDIFILKADAVLKEPVDKGIGYAEDYKQALDILAIYGKSLAAARVAAIQAAQECARVMLQQKLAQQQQARLNQLVASLTVGGQPIALMMQQFYQRYLDAKSSLYAALQNYRASYFYWALAQSTVQPKIIDTVNKLETGLASLTAITLDQATALSRFDPPPQTVSGKDYAITDPNVISSLRTGQATAIIPAGAVPFLGLSRVRLDTIRVWLEGAKAPYGQRISIKISSSGNYTDRLGAAHYRFTSKPLARLFEYHVQNGQSHEPQPAWAFANGDLGFIEMDGSVDDEVKYAYFRATPFSEWTVSVNAAMNPGVDLSGITGLTFQFQGSAIAADSGLQ